MIINGKKLALKKEKRLKKIVKELQKTKKNKPRLISLVAKEDKAGLLYTKLKRKAAFQVGIDFKKITFSLEQKEKIYPLLDKILKTERFEGLIIQKPGQNLIKKYFSPKGRLTSGRNNKKGFRIWWLTATSKIPEKKDVDCLNVANLGLFSVGLIQFYPATVKAIYSILLGIYKEKELKGKNVVIIGSSEILGKPLAMLLRNKGATIFLCGSASKLKPIVKKGEIIVSCVGKSKLITAEMVRKGAVVIDAGITKVNKKIFGDVDFKNVAKKASYITPVPGGVGPLTVISLMENVVKAYKHQVLIKKTPGVEKRIAVLISNKGSGSNLQAIIDNLKARKIKGKIVVVVSDKADAYGLIRAKKNRIPAIVRPFTKFKDKKARSIYGKKLGKELKEKYQVDLVVLAGWMIILPLSFIKYFPYKIINLHPGLIPDKKGGKLKLSDGSYAESFEGEMADNAIQAALGKGITISGSTTHFVTEKVDWGPVIMRAEEKIRKSGSIDSYYGRLKKKEHIILPLSVKLFCEDKLEVKNNIVKILDKRYRKHRE